MPRLTHRCCHHARSGALIAALLITVMATAPAIASPTAKNVIMMIPDGCSFEQYTLARWVKGAPLALDGILTGAVRTYIADSVVADSAPAASAYATGRRTSDKLISVAPKTEGLLPGVLAPPGEAAYRPLATVLEAARLAGKAVGIVATSRVSHATPAAFVSHVSRRDLEFDIMEQAVYQGVDVVLGGGGSYLLGAGQHLPGSGWAWQGRRPDGENLTDVLHARGYGIITTRKELLNVRNRRVFGLFASGHMAPDIDRHRTAPEEPSLAEMTAAAIGILSADPDGFFLMVEGSQVDWADHANDPAHLVSDLLMFDAAVKTAMDFAHTDGRTLVLAMPDHNTGGMTIGNSATNGRYSQMPVADVVAPLKRMTASSGAIVQQLGKDRRPASLITAIARDWGIRITVDDATDVLEKMAAYSDTPHYAIGEVLSPRYLVLGWTTHGHCGGDVPLGAFGPGRPAGLLDAPDIGRTAAAALGLDLENTTLRLFVDAARVFGADSVSVATDSPENRLARIDYKGKTAMLAVNKNLLQMDGRTHELEGVVVFIPETGKLYLPQDAVASLKTTRFLP
ncbi:MAG: alkaline phosphatase [Pseudomonadota bacterium]